MIDLLSQFVGAERILQPLKKNGEARVGRGVASREIPELVGFHIGEACNRFLYSRLWVVPEQNFLPKNAQALIELPIEV